MQNDLALLGMHERPPMWMVWQSHSTDRSHVRFLPSKSSSHFGSRSACAQVWNTNCLVRSRRANLGNALLTTRFAARVTCNWMGNLHLACER